MLFSKNHLFENYVCPNFNLTSSPSPENEDKEDQQSTENGDVVHCLEHHDELSSEVGQKPNQLEYSQESKRPEDGKCSAAMCVSLEKTLEDLHPGDNHNDPVKDIESITDVANAAIGYNLQGHFNKEDKAKHNVAHFNDRGQFVRLEKKEYGRA